MVSSNYKYRLIKNLPILGKVVKDFEKDVAKSSLKKASLNLIKKTGGRLKIKGLSKKLKKVFANSSVLVVCNHPYDIEMLPLLAALEDRKDICVIVAAELLGIGPNVSQYLIPVYINKKTLQKSKKLSIKLFKNLPLRPGLTFKQERSQNIQAIKNAVQKLNKGAMVLMFPAGLMGKDSDWFSGIGWLVQGLGKKSQVYLVNAYIKGTSNFDILRLVPGIGKLFPGFKVVFSKPQKISSFFKNNINNPKKLAKKLQKKYDFWSKRLK